MHVLFQPPSSHRSLPHSPSSLYRDIKHVVEGEPQQLIESVAERVAQRILDRYGAVHSVVVRVEKPHVAVEGVVASLGVEVTRKRTRALEQRR